MCSRVYATRHIKDPVSLVEKGRASSLGGRFPPSFILQKSLSRMTSYDCNCSVLALKMTLDADRAVRPPLSQSQ